MTDTQADGGRSQVKHSRSLLQCLVDDPSTSHSMAELAALLTIVAQEVEYRAERRMDLDSIETAEWLYDQADKARLTAESKA